MVKINLTPRALSDLDEIVEYAEKQSAAYAGSLTRRIFDRIAHLADFPNIGRIVPEIGEENIRELVSGNYRIVYKVYENHVDVLTIQHSSQLLAGL